MHSNIAIEVYFRRGTTKRKLNVSNYTSKIEFKRFPKKIFKKLKKDFNRNGY